MLYQQAKKLKAGTGVFIKVGTPGFYSYVSSIKVTPTSVKIQVEGRVRAYEHKVVVLAREQRLKEDQEARIAVWNDMTQTSLQDREGYIFDEGIPEFEELLRQKRSTRGDSKRPESEEVGGVSDNQKSDRYI